MFKNILKKIFGRSNPKHIISPQFDRDYYLSCRPDVADAGLDPLEHYLLHGWKEGSNPSPQFNSAMYLEQNQDVKQAGIEPFTHFLKFGVKEGRKACPVEKIIEKPFPNSNCKSASRFQRKLPEDGLCNYSSPLIVAGFHRSGTSLTANLLYEAGMHMGNQLLGANFSNPYGHYEDTDVVAFHDKLLTESGTSWQVSDFILPMVTKDNFKWLLNYGIRKSNFRSWGVKDPRISLFLPYWGKVFPDMSVLYVYRPCVEAVQSIKKRAARDLLEGKAEEVAIRFWREPDLAVKMYLFYARRALKFLHTYKGRWAVMSLKDLICGRDIISEIIDNWNYSLNTVSVRDIYDSKVLTEAGPNEIIHNESLLTEITQVEKELERLSKVGLTKF